MSNTDNSSYILRFDLDAQVPQYFSGADWYTIPAGSASSLLLTGYVSGAGTVMSTDTLLQGIQKLNGNQALYLPLAGGTLTGTLQMTPGGATQVQFNQTSGAVTNSVYTEGSGSHRLILQSNSGAALIIDGVGGLITANAEISSNSPFRTTSDIACGTTTNVASAVLLASSTTQGFLPPVMTNTQRDAISSPAAGLVLYSTTDNALEIWNGSSWVAAGGSVSPLAAISLVNQGANIAPTTLFVAPAAGLYTVAFYTFAPTTDSGATNDLEQDLEYTDISGAKTLSMTGLDLTSNSGGPVGGTVTIQVVNGGTVTYSATAVGGAPYGAATYNLAIVVRPA